MSAPAAHERAPLVANDKRAKARISAWLLAGLVVFFYVGYIGWSFVRGYGAAGLL